MRPRPASWLSDSYRGDSCTSFATVIARVCGHRPLLQRNVHSTTISPCWFWVYAVEWRFATMSAHHASDLRLGRAEECWKKLGSQALRVVTGTIYARHVVTVTQSLHCKAYGFALSVLLFHFCHVNLKRTTQAKQSFSRLTGFWSFNLTRSTLGFRRHPEFP